MEISLSTSFDSMDDSKSKSTDVSMEDALQAASKDALALDEDDLEDLPTPPATPPLEERLKSPMSTTSRSPPSPTVQMTPTKKVDMLIHRGLKLDGAIGQGEIWKFVTPSKLKIFQNPSCPILEKIK